MTSEDPSKKTSVDKALAKLRVLADRMRILGLAIALCTLCSIVTLLVVKNGSAQRVFVSAIPTAALVLLLIHEDQKKRARVIYREVVDELHWRSDTLEDKHERHAGGDK